MKLYIKNMYTKKDISKVSAVLSEMNIRYDQNISPGELIIYPQHMQEAVDALKQRLEKLNYFIIFDRKLILTEQIKSLVFKMFEDDDLPAQNYSIFISKNLRLNYNYVATIFSEIEGTSVEYFIIEQKIKKAKELLQGENYKIGEIASMLHYSSIGHFSNQFKKHTGSTPSAYRSKRRGSRVA